MSTHSLAGPPKKLTDFPHVNLFAAEIVTEKGRHPWTFASRKKQPGKITTADAAVIVAIIPGDEPRLVITREFRAPLGVEEISMPSGLIDSGESAETAATRELREETGLTLSRISLVSPPVASSAGLTDETVSYVYGEASGSPSRAHQTEHESIAVELATLTELRALLTQPHRAIISSRLYPIMIAFVSAGKIALPTF
ncbi:MAG TPA: NUDIX hydrolase [Opitutaceae bacterium]